MEYKRFTERNGEEVITNCKECEYDKEHCMICTEYHCIDALKNRLAEFEDDLESGKLVRLPCKVGDTVYFVNDYRPTPRIEEYVVYGIMLNGSEVILHIDFMETINAKNVCLTKAEAEEKLKGVYK